MCILYIPTISLVPIKHNTNANFIFWYRSEWFYIQTNLHILVLTESINLLHLKTIPDVT